MARSEAHADQYDTETLRWALAHLSDEAHQDVIRRVLNNRRHGKTTRISGSGK
jgi:hypothetical protein